MGLRRIDKLQLFTRTYTKTNTRWLVHSLSTFGVKTSHEQLRIHKIHHGLDLGEATTFPFILYYAPLHKNHIQMAFCPGTPKWESRNSHNWVSCDFGAHNFACRPLIVMRFKEKLQPSSKSFQRYVACCLHARKFGQFLTFSGHKLCFRCPNGRCKPNLDI